MSEAVVREVIGKAVVDHEYRDLLFKDPARAVEGLDLTSDELKGLTGLEPDIFNLEGSEMESRISRAGIHFGSAGIKAALTPSV
jgi:hypothetical protein